MPLIRRPPAPTPSPTAAGSRPSPARTPGTAATGFLRRGLAGHALPALLALVLAGCMERPETAHFGPPEDELGPRVIEVFGQATVAGTPNIAEIVVAVVTTGAQADEAYRTNVAQTAKITQNLLNHGVRPTDVLPRGFALEQPPAAGAAAGTGGGAARAIRELTVVARDLEALPKVLGAVLAFGGEVGSIRFQVANSEPLEERAREKAVLDARERAQAFAQELGLRLGEPITLREVPPTEVVQLGDLGRGVPFTDDDRHEDQYLVRATVEVVFALVPF